MQPYFVPYIGYWQLISAVDLFVIFDDVQYMRHGWINRNRVLKPSGGWQYIIIPLEKHSLSELIRNVKIHPTIDWKNRILRQLEHYRHKASHYWATVQMLRHIFESVTDRRIGSMNFALLKYFCQELNVKTELILSSELGITYAGIKHPGEWALRIADQIGATEYINPVGGAALFRPEEFTARGIKLKFLRPEAVVYPQNDHFEPWLSIVDVLMFNGVAGTKPLLKFYSNGGL